MSKTIKAGMKIIITTIGLLMIYVALTVAATQIPRDKIMESATGANEIIQSEGLYPSVFLWNTVTFYDNYSDAIYLNIILSQDKEHPLTSAIANYYVNNGNPLIGLEIAIQGNRETTCYAHYWLGIVPILKVLMVFFQWKQIRYIMYFCVSFLMIYVSVLLRHKFGDIVSLAFLLSNITFDFPYLASNIEAFPDLLIMLSGSAYLIKNYEKMKDDLIGKRVLFFYITGSLTFFLGFVFAPIIGIGVLVTIAYMLDIENNKIIVCLKNLFFELAGYGIGYIVTMICKQTIARNKLGYIEGYNQIEMWTSGSFFERFDGIKIVISNICKTDIVYASLIICLFLILFTIKQNKNETKTIRMNIGIVLIPMLLTMFWCILVDKACKHGFYANNCFAVFFSILCYIPVLVNNLINMKNGKE